MKHNIRDKCIEEACRTVKEQMQLELKEFYVKYNKQNITDDKLNGRIYKYYGEDIKR